MADYTQEEMVEEWLKRKDCINNLEALDHLGVYRLSAVILLLRKAGLNIVTEKISYTNRKGQKKTVANYVFIKPVIAGENL